jgi:ADP-ribose pyrophosphatase
MTDDFQILAETKYIRLVRRGNWAFAQRPNATAVVGIAAVTQAGKLLLVEQYRAPFDRRVIELPAGIAGDLEGQERESPETAARRELLEETGYEAGTLEQGPTLASSAGLTDETSVLFFARGVRKVGDGGGDGSENIQVHEIPLDNIEQWLREAAGCGRLIDSRVYAALHFLGAESD